MLVVATIAAIAVLAALFLPRTRPAPVLAVGAIGVSGQADTTSVGPVLRDMLATPAREFTEFPAALSFLPNLPRTEAIDALVARVARLQERLAALDDEIAEVGRFLPRLFAIESEFQRQVVDAELTYVRGLIADLRTERVTWPSNH